GALNTMFATVASRMREIATLRAIGFRSVPVVVAVMLETMLLALLGGLLGGLLAWIVFNGYAASTIAGGVGQLNFEFDVSLPVLWTGLKWALAIGFVGGLFPARSEEHTSELQSRENLVCRLLLEKKKAYDSVPTT